MARQLNANGANVPTPAEWRAAMGYFPTGVTIVTSWKDRDPVGSTVNAFCSVSLDPPMLLVCLDRSNPILGPIERSRVFGVNILCEDTHHLASHFATSPESGRFRQLDFHSVGAGAPQLDLAPMFVDCALENIHAAGDHFVMIGRGLRTDHVSTAAPLLYHRGRFHKFPGTAA
jgi:3-hydroxy-9,10-secoandrosta-1,3,5(10)-triene-9,17-dione monooxygenase reductase component